MPSREKISSVQDIALAMSFLYKCIHLFHVVVYVDFIKFTIMCMCRKMIMLRSEIDRNNWQKTARKKLYVMRQAKLIHFRIWHIAQCVDDQFGWFLTSFPGDAMSPTQFTGRLYH